MRIDTWMKWINHIWLLHSAVFQVLIISTVRPFVSLLHSSAMACLSMLLHLQTRPCSYVLFELNLCSKALQVSIVNSIQNSYIMQDTLTVHNIITLISVKFTYDFPRKTSVFALILCIWWTSKCIAISHRADHQYCTVKMCRVSDLHRYHGW